MCQHVLLKLYWGIICTRLSSFIEKFQENRSSIFINRSLDSPLLGLIPLLPESSAVASCELPSGKAKTGQAASLLFSASERLVSGKWRRSPPTPAGSWRSREALVPPLAEPPSPISDLRRSPGGSSSLPLRPPGHPLLPSGSELKRECGCSAGSSAFCLFTQTFPGTLYHKGPLPSWCWTGASCEAGGIKEKQLCIKIHKNPATDFLKS